MSFALKISIRRGQVLKLSSHRHGHKQTVQACKWGGPGNNLVVTASRDHFLKVYDIRMMRDLYTLRGHKNEVCSAFKMRMSLPEGVASSLVLISPAGVAWHPIHQDLLVSGGSEGSMVYWSLQSEDPETPVFALDNAHDSNIWALSWHPLGHLLASGSNDHATKFWCRARPQGPEDTSWVNQQQQQQQKMNFTQSYGGAQCGGGGGYTNGGGGAPGMAGSMPGFVNGSMR